MPQSIENPREAQQCLVIPHNKEDFEAIKQQPLETAFQIDKDVEIPIDTEVEVTRRKQAQLATIHERLGHLSFDRLKLLARVGLIPRNLSNVEPPTCPGCAYGKQHRKPWRHKGLRNRKVIKPATSPGQVISVDQMVSRTMGLVPTHRGIPTTKRYVGATVFADHNSDFTYVHLMTELRNGCNLLASIRYWVYMYYTSYDWLDATEQTIATPQVVEGMKSKA